MLSRRFLRIKVLQSLYAFHQEGSGNVAAAERSLFKSLDKLYELYIYQLSLIVAVVEFARQRMEENKQKFLPTAEDLDPNLRFLQNQLINKLEINRQLNRLTDEYHIYWKDEEDLIRKLYNKLRESEEFINYMSSEENTFARDKYIVSKVLLSIISESELLRFYLEEKFIYWNEDFDLSIMMVDKTLASIKERNDEFTLLPTLLKDESRDGGSEDKEFIKALFRKTIVNDKEFEKLVDEQTENWEKERIALMDMLLLKMALAELTEIASIPVKVTLNEYIELSKEYSTPRSKIFVNGILDKLINKLKQSGQIKKVGRGLME